MKFSDLFYSNTIYEGEHYSIAIVGVLNEGKYPCAYRIAKTDKYTACGGRFYADKKKRVGGERETPISDEEVKIMFEKIYPSIVKDIKHKKLIPDTKQNKAQCRCEELVMSVAFSVDTDENGKLFFNVLSVMPKFKNYDPTLDTNVAYVWNADGGVTRESITGNRGSNIVGYKKQFGQGY